MLSPAKPQDESTGALLRSASAVSVPRASDVPSVEALLKQVRDDSGGIYSILRGLGFYSVPGLVPFGIRAQELVSFDPCG